MKTVRCVICGQTYNLKDVLKANKCPDCSTVLPPLNPELDVTITLNWEELRLLAQWAENWGIDVDPLDHASQAFAAIMYRLSQYRPPEAAPLTILEEQIEIKPIQVVQFFREGIVSSDGKVVYPINRQVSYEE